jgi:hypothetical protein
MRRNILFISVLFGWLFVAPAAFATSYSGSTLLDWSTLTFSGIGFSFSSQFQSQFTHVDVDEVALLTPGGKLSTFNDPSWVSHTLIDSISQIGTAVSIADTSVLYASASQTGIGAAVASTERFASFIPTATGNLTISINYTLMQSGVLDNTPFLGNQRIFATTSAFLNLTASGFPFNPITADITTSGAGLRNELKTGTLSFTRWFNAGESGELRLGVSSISAQVVPVPDMLWPTLLGMLGVGLYAERARCRSLMY